MNKRTLIISLILIPVIAAASVWLWRSQTVTASNEELLETTGVIEARTVSLAPEVGGRVIEVMVEEGQRVTDGQTLLRLDQDAMLAQREGTVAAVAQAQAALETAQAQLKLEKSGATPDEIAAAEAAAMSAEGALAAAEAALAQAKINAESARTMERVESSVAKAEAALARTEGMVAAAKGDLARAVAERAQLQARARPEEIAIYQALVNEAHWNFRYFENLHFSNFVDREIDDDRAEQARLQRENARNAADAAQSQLDLIKAGATTEDVAAASATVGTAQAQLTIAEAGVVEAEAALAQAQGAPETRQDQVAMADAGVAKAEAQVEIAQGQLDQTESDLARLNAGATTEEIAVLQAQVAQAEGMLASAQAMLKTLEIQLGKFTIIAPWDGILLTRSTEPGATALPGSTLMEIGRLDRLKLTVYLPEDRFGLVSPGQTASVRVDTYPDRLFEGTVSQVADQAEFTPSNIQTKDDRVRLVYAVTISLDNADLALKPGMIADVLFGE